MGNGKKTPRFYLALAAGKVAATALTALRRNGGQIPGYLAERIDPDFLAHMEKPEHIVFVTGTNGKTTTSNLLDDLLVDNGFDLLTNRAGGNVANGIESSLIKNARMSGSQRKSYACMELDELSSRLVLPHVTPDILLVCNLYRDSFMRNANPDYIFDVISKNVSPDTELVLNADDLISCRLAPQATKRTYFSVGHLPGDADRPHDIAPDLGACPECGGALSYDWCHVRHLGRARCVSCGFTNPEPDFEVTWVDEEAHRFAVRENREPGRPEQTYHIETYSITNLYNLLSAIVVARRLGVPAADIARSLDKGINITSLRYSSEVVAGTRLVAAAAKGENSTATSTAIATICGEPGRKAVVITLADNYLATNPYGSEYTGWYYQTDFECLDDPLVEQVVVVGARGEDLMLRLLLAGIDPARLRLAKDMDEAVAGLSLAGLDGVFVAFDIFNGDQVARCKELLRARLEAGEGAAVGDADAAAGDADATVGDPDATAQADEPSRRLPATDVDSAQGSGCVVEVLYPEFGNQAGDGGNALYLKACLPGATFVETPYGTEPAFATRDVDAIIMSSMTERHQELAAAALRPYAERLAELADAGVPMLFTHSAAEVLGTSFGTRDGGRQDGLGVLDFSTRLDMPKRYLCSLVGTFDPADGTDPMTILGFKIQFTQMRGNGAAQPFAKVERGWGLAEGSTFEGFRRGGLIAAWTLGPLLATNPDFAAWFCRRVTGSEVSLAFEREARAAYDVRHEELTKPLPKGKTINP